MDYLMSSVSIVAVRVLGSGEMRWLGLVFGLKMVKRHLNGGNMTPNQFPAVEIFKVVKQTHASGPKTAIEIYRAIADAAQLDGYQQGAAKYIECSDKLNDFIGKEQDFKDKLGQEYLAGVAHGQTLNDKDIAVTNLVELAAKDAELARLDEELDNASEALQVTNMQLVRANAAVDDFDAKKAKYTSLVAALEFYREDDRRLVFDAVLEDVHGRPATDALAALEME